MRTIEIEYPEKYLDIDIIYDDVYIQQNVRGTLDELIEIARKSLLDHSFKTAKIVHCETMYELAKLTRFE